MKKLAVLLVAIAILASSVMVNANVFTDTQGIPAENAINILASLGIVEGKSEGLYEPQSPLTRAEMVTILLRAIDMPALQGRDIFEDVPSTHWAYANITMAYDTGMINGVSKTEFAPDQNVTYAQAVKMTVALLGYSVKAETEGGFPSGYISVGAQTGITKGVLAENFNRGEMAKLIYNALEVSMFEKTHYGENANQYAESKNTLLNTYLKAYRVREKVEATAMTAIVTPTRELLSDEAQTNTGAVYKNGKTNLQNMLGIVADIYYREDVYTDAKVALAAIPVSATEVFDVEAEKISKTTDTNIFVYEDESGNLKRINIAGAKLVYNGRAKTLTAKDLIPDIGSVRIINENGGSADTIIVQNFVNAVVDNVDTENDRVYFMDGIDIDGETDKRDMEINTEDETVVLYDASGEAITLADLAEWDILSIVKNDDIILAYRSANSITGKVTEKDSEFVTVSDIKYSLDPKMPAISVGIEAKFYLDFLGNIAALDKDAVEAKTYGWLVNAGVTEGLSGKPQFKIFTEDGEMKVFNMNERLIFNGVSHSSTEMANYITGNISSDLYANGKVAAQLILFEADEENNLKKITTAENDTVTTDETKFGGDFSMDYYLPKGNSSAREWNGTKSGGSEKEASTFFTAGNLFGKVGITSSTKYFIIPGDVENDKGYRIGNMRKEVTYDSFKSTECISLYDISEEYVCGAVVKHGYLSGSDTKDVIYTNYEEEGLGLICEAFTTLDSDGVEVSSLRILDETGNEVLATIDSECVFGYKFAVADIEEDPAWWTRDENGNRVDGTDKAARNALITDRAKAVMNIDADKLRPGDIIRFKLDEDLITGGSVVFRSEYKGNYSVIQYNEGDKEYFASVRPERIYNGGSFMAAGTVLETTPYGFITELDLLDGGLTYKETTKYHFPKDGKVVMWDEGKGEGSMASVNDVLRDDIIFVEWERTSQKFIVVYR